MENVNSTKELLIRIAGYDIDTAKSCSTAEFNKLAMHGTIVLIPSIIGFFTMSYAMILFTKNTTIGVFSGVIWSIIILLLDRAILTAGNTNGSINIAMVTRFLLAMAIGFTVAEPAVLYIFRDSIEQAFHDDYRASKKIVEREFQPKFQAINQQLQSAKSDLDRKQKIYTIEMDGKGSDKGVGKGVIFEQKYKDYLKAENEYKDLKKELKITSDKLNTNFESDISGIQAAKAVGLAGRIDMLHKIDSPAITIGSWAIRILLFLIELVPFMIKLTPGTSAGYWDFVDVKNEDVFETFKAGGTYRKELFKQNEKTLNEERLFRLQEKAANQEAEHYQRKANQMAKNQFKAVNDKMEYTFQAYKKVEDEKEMGNFIANLDKIYKDLGVKMNNIIDDSNINFNKN